MRFVLASASPARLATLRAAGLDPEVVVSGVDEAGIVADTPRELVQVLADAKLAAVSQLIEQPAFVLACDSMLELDGAALGKPASPDAAVQRWRAMRGRSGVLHTGHALLGPAGTSRCTVSTTVHFADVTDAEIDRYVASGEPLQVAGAFTIDGLGGWFVERIDGDHHNVVGVSLPAVRVMVRAQGYELSDLGLTGRRT
jgi:septum formation protein